MRAAARPGPALSGPGGLILLAGGSGPAFGRVGVSVSSAQFARLQVRVSGRWRVGGRRREPRRCGRARGLSRSLVEMGFELLPAGTRAMENDAVGDPRLRSVARTGPASVPLEGALGTQWRGHDQGPGLPHSGEGWPPVSPPGEKISSLMISGGGDGGCGEPTVLSLGPVHKSLRRSVRRLNPGLRQDRTPVLPLYYPVPAPIQPPSS